MHKQPAALNDASAFTRFLHQHIVASDLLAMQVMDIGANAVIIKAPVAGPNLNIHQTAFAGSIYSVCALAGWSLGHHRLALEGIAADVVMGKAQITYLAPIVNEIVAQISVEEAELQLWLSKLRSKGKGSIAACIEAVEDGQVKAKLEGKLVAICL